MDKQLRDNQLRRLTASARIAGRSGNLTPRTHYLDRDELRTVSAARLVREAAWAERPGASEEWREGRRSEVADEFDRRGFTDTSTQVRTAWSDTEAAEAREAEAREQARRAEREAEQARTDTREPVGADVAAVAVSAAAFLAIADMDHPGTEDRLLADEETRLDQAWAPDADHPAMGGEHAGLEPGGIEADMADTMTGAAGTEWVPAEVTEPETAPEQAPEM